MNTQGREMEFTDWLLKRMEERELNQSDLARLMGKGRSYINKLLGGSYGLTFENAKLISKALKLPLNDILTAAGMLPPVQDLKNALAERFAEVLYELPDDDVDDLYTLALAKLERHKRNK